MEGLWLMFKEGTYYLFYSASAFQLPTYRMMVARSESLLGPYVKADFSNIPNQHHKMAQPMVSLLCNEECLRVMLVVCWRCLC